MSLPKIILDWQGPFTLEKAIDHPLSQQKGIYLFACEYLGKQEEETSSPTYLIRWPGYTNASFRKRLMAWRSQHRAGMWYILDSDDMQIGKHTILWGTESTKMTEQEKQEFKRWKRSNEPVLEKMLSTFRIFFAPLEEEDWKLKRIEAAIMEILYSQSGPVREVLDEGMQYTRRKHNEIPFDVECAQVGLLGLPETFIA